MHNIPIIQLHFAVRENVVVKDGRLVGFVDSPFNNRAEIATHILGKYCYVIWCNCIAYRNVDYSEQCSMSALFERRYLYHWHGIQHALFHQVT